MTSSTDQEPVWCDCPSDWVCCIDKRCPRARAIREAEQAKFERTIEVLGDPAEGVSLCYGEGPRKSEG